MPLVMSSSEWARLASWTDPEKDIAEVKRAAAFVRRLDEASKQMTKNWPNSVENVNKRNEEMRRARLATAESANARFYKRYVKRKREEQARLLYSARDIVFKNKDAPKMMLTAVVESVIQAERMAQLKFKEERKEEQKKQKEEDDNEIIRKAAEWHALNETRRKRRFEVNKQHQKEILAQAHERSERKRIEHETELEFQKRDNIEGTRQMEALAKFDAEFKAAEKAHILADMEQARREHEARRAECVARDQMDDKLIDVRQRSLARVVALRKQTEDDIKTARWKVLELVSKQMQSATDARDAAEEACRLKAEKECEAAEQEKLREKKRKQQEYVAMRQQARRDFLADEERRAHELDTRRQWELMNRFKNSELYEEYKKQIREEKARKVKEFKEDALRLWKERDEREARERAETRHFYGELALQKLRLADNQLLTYAGALVDEARRAGRPDRPLRRAVHNYCKMYGLYPEKDIPKSMREHFKTYKPCDRTAPDPEFRVPSPPPPDRGPDAPDDEPAPAPGPAPAPAPASAPAPAPAPGPKRDGLQPAIKVASPKPPAPAPGAEYKRAARANGLQRRNAEHELKLPPIVVPCETAGCSCELKNKK